MSEERKRKKKKGKDDESILENEIFHIMEVSLKEALDIGTHSFRKWYATEIYKNNGYDITLVQRLLQHSSAAITQRYIGIEPQRIEEAIEGHAQLL